MILGGGEICDFSFSKAWGVNPAAATGTVLLDIADGGGSTFELAVGDYITYSFGSVASFPGVVSEVGTATDFGKGLQQTFTVVDNRVRLGWQTVFGAWNIEDDIYGKSFARPVTPSTGADSGSSGDDKVHVEGADSTFVPFINATAADAGETPTEVWGTRRRFKHLLPEHWESGTWTYSDAPLTVKEILNSAFNHAWGDYGFTRTYHSSMATAVVTGLDYTTGVKLSNLISEINSKTALDCYLSGSRTLVWGRKGVGMIPVPDSSATPISNALALTSTDTRIRVVGERVRMQQINVELEPDWNRNFDPFIDELAWLRYVALRFEKPHTTKAEMADLAAFAREVTVRDLAEQVNHGFFDSRPFGKISRNDIPVWVYLRELVYRSYRIPLDYVCHGVPLASLDIADGLLAATDIDGEGDDAKQIYARDPVEYYPAVQASAICKGQPLDLLNARDIRLFYRNATENYSGQWTIAPQFEVDTLGKSIRFQVPTFIDGDPEAGKSIYLMPNRGEGGGTNIAGDVPAGSDYLDIAVPNPDFEIEPAQVKASFTFLLGRFYRDYGAGPRRGSVTASGLDMHVLDCTFDDGLEDPGVKLLDDTDLRLPDMEESLFQEVLYYDGDGAVAKANAVAASLLSLSPTQTSGGFTRHGLAGTNLSPVIDRITVLVNFNEAVTERVDYTKARSTSAALAERTLERLQRSEELFSGADNLKREVRELRLIAAMERNAKTASRARTHTTFADVFERPSGAESGASTLVNDEREIGFQAGEIVWLDDKGVPTLNGGTFGGIAVANTKGDSNGRQMYIAHSGRVPVKVSGGVAVGGLVMGTPGEKVGKAAGHVAIGRLTHGESVSNYASNMLVYLDVSAPQPSCRFRITFDAGKQRLYCGPGSLGLIHQGAIVLPIEPTLNGTGINSGAPPWWEISGQTIGVKYQVMCKYSAGRAIMLLHGAYDEALVLTQFETAWVVATVTFGIEAGTGKYKLEAFQQVWWSDITIDFDFDGSTGDGGPGSTSGGGGFIGSDKSTAIVGCGLSPTGFLALACLESPDVRFPDVARIPVTSCTTRWTIDPIYMAVCEPGTIWATAAGNTACPVGAEVVGNEVIIRTGFFRRPSHVVISLTAIRKGFAGWRFPTRSLRQFIANEASINSNYPAE